MARLVTKYNIAIVYLENVYFSAQLICITFLSFAREKWTWIRNTIPSCFLQVNT